MKRWLVGLMVMGTLATTAQAIEPYRVNVSSRIAATGTGCFSANFLDLVIIDVASTSGVLELYNSTWTTNSVLISSMSLGTVGERYFSNTAVKGLCWKTSTNTNGVVIIHKK